MDKDTKTGLITKFAVRKGDSGSTEVQVALLTERIKELTAHMSSNPNDYGGQRGLLKLVGQRRKLLSYLSKTDVVRYHSLIKGLGLRK